MEQIAGVLQGSTDASDVFTCWTKPLRYKQRISGIYAANLLGAGLGSFGVVILLSYIFTETAVIIVSILSVVAAALSWRALKRESTGWLIGIIVSGLLLLLLCFFPPERSSPTSFH